MYTCELSYILISTIFIITNKIIISDNSFHMLSLQDTFSLNQFLISVRNWPVSFMFISHTEVSEVNLLLMKSDHDSFNLSEH